MPKSKEKVTPLVTEFSVNDVKKQFDKVYSAQAKKAGEFVYPVARAIYKKVKSAVNAKSGLSKNEVKELYTSITKTTNTPNRYFELELAGNMLKIDLNKAGIKYLQDCINMAGLDALQDSSNSYYYEKPEHRRSLQNGGLNKTDVLLEMKMLPVVKVPSNKGTTESDTVITHLLPSITGNDIAITENASDNWFFSLEKDIKTGYFVDALAMFELEPSKIKMIEGLSEDFWQEVHARIRAKTAKLTYEGYLEVNRKAKTGTNN